MLAPFAVGVSGADGIVLVWKSRLSRSFVLLFMVVTRSDRAVWLTSTHHPPGLLLRVHHPLLEATLLRPARAYNVFIRVMRVFISLDTGRVPRR